MKKKTWILLWRKDGHQILRFNYTRKHSAMVAYEMFGGSLFEVIDGKSYVINQKQESK